MIWFAAGANWPEARSADRLECTTLSVGHGCAVVLELPGGQTLLYDAGQLGMPSRGARTIAGFLWLRGITRIDAVIVSHADVDHYNALPELLQRFPIGAVYVSPVMFREKSAALDALKTAIEDAGTELRLLSAGDELDAGSDCRLRVLHPPATGVLGSDNANSLVLAVEYAGRRLLLPGDLDSPGLDRLLSQDPLDCDVVLAPHHGSLRSNPPSFAAWSSPEWVLISGPRHDRQPGVYEAYAAAGARALRTAESGAIFVSIDKGGVAVDTWR
ncbi:MAG: MBL fold metallo-hydrolase [Planctomycetes bacterium]|nr:MBL fold metallo-hydrolase [Planctomycetota bacterium]